MGLQSDRCMAGLSLDDVNSTESVMRMEPNVLDLKPAKKSGRSLSRLGPSAQMLLLCFSRPISVMTSDLP